MRHTIDKSTIRITENHDYEGFCRACNKRVSLYTYAFFDSNNHSHSRFRCRNAHQAHYKSKRSHNTRKAKEPFAEQSNSEQDSCGLCGGYMRKNRHGVRALYAVSTPDGLLDVLFCWDCRTILREYIAPRYQQQIADMLKVHQRKNASSLSRGVFPLTNNQNQLGEHHDS